MTHHGGSVPNWMNDSRAIGLDLKRKWRHREFHAVVTIEVPREPLNCGCLPVTTADLDETGRFSRLIDRNRTLVARGVLRGVMGTILGTRPEEVTISRTPRGKQHVYAAPGISVSH